MNKERKILEKTIKDSQKIIDKAKKDLEALEVTYSIGDRFVDGDGHKYFLCNGGHAEIHFVSLRDGTGSGKTFKAICNSRITETELRLTSYLCYLTRYFDFQKGELA